MELLKNERTGELAWFDKNTGKIIPFREGVNAKIGGQTSGEDVLGLTRSALGGATFNFADELGIAPAAVAARLSGADQSIPDIYRDMKDAYTAQQSDWESRNPNKAMGAGLLGGGAIGKALAKPVMGLLSNPYAASTAAGATAGGLYAAGATDYQGDMMGDIVKPVGTGATMGGALGFGIPLMAAGAYKGGRWLIDRFKNLTSTPAGYAEGQLAKNVGRDEMTADEVVNKMRDLGPQSRAVDAGGENVLALGETVANYPGAGKGAIDFLTKRQKGQFQRLMADIKRATGKDGAFLGGMRALINKRAKQASPYYKKAEAEYVDEQDIVEFTKGIDSKIQQFEATPIGEGLKRIRAMLYRTVEGPKGPEKILKTNIGKELHAVKMNIDDKIDSAKRSGRGAYVKELMELKTELLRFMDKASPNYAKGRSLFATDSAIKDAMETGKKILREDAEEMADYVRGLSVSERDGFIMGAAKAIRDKLASVGDRQNAAMRIAGSPMLRERLRPAFPSDAAYDDFMKAVGREERFTEVVNKIARNSRTQPRQAAQDDLLGDLANRDASSVIRKVWQAIKGSGYLSENTRKELGKLLFEAGPDEVLTILNRRGIESPGANRLSDEIRGILAISASQPEEPRQVFDRTVGQYIAP